MYEWVSLLLIASLCAMLLFGFPVAFTLAGVSLFFALVGSLFGIFDIVLLHTLPSRIFGIFNNVTLMAVPLFVFMGTVLEKSRIAEDLLDAMSAISARLPGGLALSVLLVGTLLAASTGIVGATVVTLGLLALPGMLRRGYDPKLATGVVAATGTLGQIIPPSIALILLADVIANSFQQAQLQQGIFSPRTVSVGQLFMGALLPGLVLVGMYALYLVFKALRHPEAMPSAREEAGESGVYKLLSSLVPPLLLIVLVLGSILGGFATPTEASAVGGGGALLLALLRGKMSRAVLLDCSRATLETTSMVFTILIGASVFSLVFRGFGGDDLVQDLFTSMPGGVITAMLFVMVVIFVLGFILDFIEITYVVLPIVAPALFILGVDPIWFAVMVAVNLQTSFLTPPFGFALFYLLGVAPKQIDPRQVYAGAVPFIVLQIVLLLLLAFWPALATWLPSKIYGF